MAMSVEFPVASGIRADHDYAIESGREWVLSLFFRSLLFCGDGRQKSNAGDVERRADDREDTELLRDSRRRRARPQHVT